MFILEKPYVSDELCHYLEAQQAPVLRNAVSQELGQRFSLNLLDDALFLQKIAEGARLYTSSENALDWVYRHVTDEALLRAIRLMKDKYALRKAVQAMYPDYYFAEVQASELRNLDPKTLPLPVVLKPSVGFFSMGVYVIASLKDWHDALAAIESSMDSWADTYPKAVLGDSRFIIEEFIRGDEFAVDCYYDDNGEAVIVNIMQHDFSSDADVSDTLYYTGKSIIDERLEPFTDFLNSINRFLKVKNFPAHVELRVSGSKLVPIEFNPLRFAGWCTTDLADFAFGLKTYACYLNNEKPDWKTLLAGKDDFIYAFIILNKPQTPFDAAHFDYEKAQQGFSHVLHMRKLDTDPNCPVFGFLFTETPKNKREELDAIVRSDLSEFIRA